MDVGWLGRLKNLLTPLSSSHKSSPPTSGWSIPRFHSSKEETYPSNHLALKQISCCRCEMQLVIKFLPTCSPCMSNFYNCTWQSSSALWKRCQPDTHCASLSKNISIASPNSPCTKSVFESSRTCFFVIWRTSGGSWCSRKDYTELQRSCSCREKVVCNFLCCTKANIFTKNAAGGLKSTYLQKSANELLAKVFYVWKKVYSNLLFDESLGLSSSN